MNIIYLCIISQTDKPMDTTVTISIGGYAFHIEEKACKKLKRYLKAIATTIKEEEGAGEIMSDIESRITELLMDRPGGVQKVVSGSDVDDIIAIMGLPNDFINDSVSAGGTGRDRERSRYDSESRYERHRRFREQWDEKRSHSRYSSNSRVYRDTRNSMLGGVASGLAAYWRLDPTIVRILFVIATIASAGIGIVAYLVLWVVLPPAKTRSQRMSMKGEPITAENIKRSVQKEYERVRKGFSRWQP